MSIKTVKGPGGEELRVQEMDFQTIREEWNEYVLGNGTTVRVKSVALKIFQVLDDNDQPGLTNEGDPYIMVRSESKVTASA